MDDLVTVWIDRLKQGDDASAQQLWQRYFEELVRLAAKRLPANLKRAYDEEDIALSAFHSLCRGVKEERFPELADRDNLWALLVVITARKVARQIRTAGAQKRGGGRTRGESVFLHANGGDEVSAICQIVSAEPTAEFAAEVSEESERLLQRLPDEDMRRLALLKMEGHSNQESAEVLGCGLRTVERRLALIRKIWESK